MPFQSGTAFVPIVPSFRGFQARIARESGAGGRRGGEEFGRSFAPAAERGARGLGERLRGSLSRLDEAMGKIGLAGGAALGAGLLKAVEASTSQGKLQAQLGLSSKESARFGRLAGQLYADAYGESIDDVNTAIAAVVSSIDGMRGASDSAVRDMTAKALSLAKAFDIDVARAVQVVGQLVKSGLVKDAAQGMDLLTATLQKVPAAVREDVIDALDEYGPFMQQIGIKGQAAFELLAAGAAKGMYGIDKTGDALKEFTIRATDLSASTQAAYKTLGLDTQKVTNDLLAGGQRGANAFELIITKLRGIKDPAEQSQAALALFGTPLEDLGTKDIPKFLQSLDTTRNSLGNTAGAAQRMADSMANTDAAKIERFKRSVEQGVTNAAIGAIPWLERLGGTAKNLGITPAGVTQFALAVTGVAVAAKLTAAAVSALTFQVAGHSAASLTAAAATRTYTAAVRAWMATNFMRGFTNINAAMAANATLMTRLGAALKSQILLWRQQAAAQGVSTARVIAHAAAQRVVAAATWLWTAAQWALNAALAVVTSPIGLIVIAIGLLIGAIVILYKKNETFRNFVNAAWTAIKNAIMQAWTFIKPIFMQIAHVLINVVGTALRWYWAYVKFVFTTVWTIISYAWAGIRIIFTAIAGFLQGPLKIAWIVLQNTIKIVWIAIQIYIKIAWAIIKTYFNAIKLYITAVLIPIFKFLYNNVVKPVFNGIVTVIKWAWAGMKVVFNAIKNFLSATLAPQFRVFKSVAGNAWTGLKTVISTIWNGGIKPAFNALKSALGTVKSAFQTAVSAIKSHWDKLKGIAKTPVNFVIGIYNRGIVGLVNKLADFAGVKTRLSPIPLLARGGTLDNPMPAQPMVTNGALAIVGEGRRQYPEFVIPTDPRYRRRAQALWAMAGQKVMGSKPANKWLRGPNALNGEGIGFARGGSLQALAFGGIIGKFVDGVRNFTVGNVTKGAETLLGKVLGGTVPGTGKFRDVVAAVPGWIKRSVLDWVKKKVATFGGGPSMERALNWAKTQDGKPYQWGGNGNPSWDCSGFMSAIESVIRGQKPHRRWATSSFNGGTPPGWHRNQKSGFMIGVLDNGNAHASHTAGTLLGHNVESSGSGGVRVDHGARGFNNAMFPWRYGLKFDDGGQLPQGATLALHNARRPDRVLTDAQWSAIYGAARGSDGPSTVNNIYARTADFTVRDLEVLERRQAANARLGRPR
ncbi:phage tail tape measure protein [Actinomadura sp. NPDC049382]|uniref:phage tail tape measure protein n=1 Tax=Actinomadura sp. NPDC049382 TaxID=3158220 RepID=UPI00342A584C